MLKKSCFFLLSVCTLFLFSCQEETDGDNTNNPGGPQLKFKFKFDENQERLNNIGIPEGVAAGNAAQTPDFKGMSIHYIEMAPSAFTQLGQGDVVYRGETTSAGGADAVDFDEATVADEGEIFYSVPLSQVDPGTYEWIRTSVTYQNYDIKFNVVNADDWIGFCEGGASNRTGTVASFLGYNVYISEVTPNTETLVVNDDKLQGFWAFEIDDLGALCESFAPRLYSGESAGTTVVNPLFGTSDIPAGSCVVTGAFTQPLTVTGDETEDIVVELSYSINQSFEWIDQIPNGEFDLDAANPANSDIIIDMGVRGLIPSWE